MIEALVIRRGPFALLCDLERGWFRGDLSASNLKDARRQARRFARTGMGCPATVIFGERLRTTCGVKGKAKIYIVDIAIFWLL